MVTEAQVREALRSVLDPEIGRPIEDIGMLRGIAIEGDAVRVDVLITIEGCPLKDRITNDVTAAASASAPDSRTIAARYSDPPSSSRVSPMRRIVSPADSNELRVTLEIDSSTPIMPTTGVG